MTWTTQTAPGHVPSQSQVHVVCSCGWRAKGYLFTAQSRADAFAGHCNEALGVDWFKATETDEEVKRDG